MPADDPVLLCEEVDVSDVKAITSGMDGNGRFRLSHRGAVLLLQTPDLVIWSYEAGEIRVCVDAFDPFATLICKLGVHLSALGTFDEPFDIVPGQAFRVATFTCAHTPSGTLGMHVLDTHGEPTQVPFSRGQCAVFILRLEHAALIDGRVKVRVEAVQAHLVETREPADFAVAVARDIFSPAHSSKNTAHGPLG